MAWNDIKMPSNGGDILKMESGKAYRVRIVGEPYVYQSEFEGNPSTRYAMAVWNQDEQTAQILLLPGGAFRQILEYAQNEEDWGDPEQYDFVIKKTGSGLETRYTIQPSPKKTPLLDAEKAAVTAIDLADVLAKLPSVTAAYRASEVGETPFPRANAADDEEAPSLKSEWDKRRAAKRDNGSDDPEMLPPDFLMPDGE